MAKIEDAALYSALEALVGFRPAALRELLGAHSTLEGAFSSFRASSESYESVNEAYEKALKKLQSWGTSVSVLRKGDPRYPTQVAEWADAPEFLFVKGELRLLALPGVSVVGSRAASEKGRNRAFRLAKLLVENDFVVFSGLAAGIDTAAHLGALNSRGKTVAVLGTPLDKAYPKENANLQSSIAENGALVSQFSPLRPTQPLNFPLRNALMSALSLATVIVEASETSGALIQARAAIRQGRQLFIMRNQIERSDLKWPREYLKKGAKAVGDIDELLENLKRPAAPDQLRLI